MILFDAEYLFVPNETLIFKVFYTLAGVYVGGRGVNFTTSLERVNNKPVYHLWGWQGLIIFYDNFFKVRDKYESYSIPQPCNLTNHQERLRRGL